MKKILFIAGLAASLLSCNSAGDKKTGTQNETKPAKDSAAPAPDTADTKKIGFFTVEGDSLVAPAFDIVIELSKKAKEKIEKGNESIVVDVFLDGTPGDMGTAKLEEDGSFFVGSAKKEIKPGEVAHFDNLKIARSIYDQLLDKDPNVTVNIYTGRKTFPDNLITGDFISDKLSKIVNRKFTSKQHLIYGDK